MHARTLAHFTFVVDYRYGPGRGPDQVRKRRHSSSMATQLVHRVQPDSVIRANNVKGTVARRYNVRLTKRTINIIDECRHSDAMVK